MQFFIFFLIIEVVLSFFKSVDKKMKFPVQGKISSPFGDRIHPITKVKSFHNGIDIACKEDTKVICPADGVVIGRYSNEKGGNQLIIQHTNGYITGYAHLNSISVKFNQSVKQGQIIALTGNTGASTGAHLHFTLKDSKGKYLDPLKFLKNG